jgi:hypothetical protein
MNRNFQFYLKFFKTKDYSLVTKTFIPKDTVLYDPLKDPNVGFLNLDDLEHFKNFNLFNYPNLYNSLHFKLEYGYVINNYLYYPINNISSKTFLTIDSNNDKIWFINHSKNNNVACNNLTLGKIISLRDIKPDEEILENYSNYENNIIYDDLCSKILGYKFNDIIKNWD